MCIYILLLGTNNFNSIFSLWYIHFYWKTWMIFLSSKIESTLLILSERSINHLLGSWVPSCRWTFSVSIYLSQIKRNYRQVDPWLSYIHSTPLEKPGRIQSLSPGWIQGDQMNSKFFQFPIKYQYILLVVSNMLVVKATWVRQIYNL